MIEAVERNATASAVKSDMPAIATKPKLLDQVRAGIRLGGPLGIIASMVTHRRTVGRKIKE